MKLTMMKTTALAVALAAFAIAGNAQTTVHRNTSTATSVGSGSGEGTGFGAGAQSTSNAKDDLFEGTEIFAKNASDVTEITMDPDSLSMVNGKDKDKARNTVLQVVRTYTYDKPGMYNIADVDKFREKLNSGEWHCSIRQRSLKTGESTDVCSKRRTDDLHETAIITVEPKELTFIHTISHHGSMMMGMPGMSGLGMFPSTLGSLSSLAMIDPEMMQLRLQFDGLKSGMALRFGPMGSNFAVMPNFDSEEIQRSIDKAQKDWSESGEKMKEFMSPDGAHRFFIAPHAPEAPEAMPAPPAPQAPPTPQSQPAPATPQAQ